MDDLVYGSRDQRGDWSPTATLQIAPIYTFPPRPLKVLVWLRSYLLPWNLLFFALGALSWFVLTPAKATMRTLAPGWVLYMFARNCVFVIVVYGSLDWWLYARRHQEQRFKFNAKWPNDQPGKNFLRRSQRADGIIRTFATGVPIWTAYEALGLWAYANGRGPWARLADHPVWFVVFGLLMSWVHEFHFYWIHRLIHVPFLYKHVHGVHHRFINPSPWSSLAMHPIEHLLYWSGSLLHLVVPSHPLLFLYHLNITGTGAVVGHIGFDKIELGENTSIDAHAYAHYLHHKYFRVNYADGTTALDKLFGSWHDGSAEADAQMRARHRAKVARLNARQVASLDASAPNIASASEMKENS
jgi:sterol desaturase/sphingolipid hydroxylase (fatty acid hydroxylase superfamily)